MRYIWFCLLLPVISHANVIGIFGDVHGDIPNARRALQQMKALGVTDIIVTGDLNWAGGYIGEYDRAVAAMRADPGLMIHPDRLEQLRRSTETEMVAQLEAVLPLIQEITGVPPSRTHIIPGNFEITPVATSTRKALEVMAQYGQLVVRSDEKVGFVTIDQRKIMLSHVALQTLPSALTPPGPFLLRRQAAAMAQNIPTPAGVDLRIYADTHMSGAYSEPASRTLVINPGVLVNMKDPGEPFGFATYDTRSQIVEFHEIGKPSRRAWVDASTLQSCGRILAPFP